MKKLVTEWVRFSAILPRGASRIQLIETRRAFYAGASALLALLQQIDDDLTEEQGAAILQSYQDEIGEFVKLVERGDA